MIKFMLIMQICSLVEKECMPAFKHPHLYDSHYECATVGYLNSIKTMDEIGQDLVNSTKIHVQFACNEVNQT